MIDDPALTWIDVPPPPPAPSDDARAAAAAVVKAGPTCTLVGTTGSGRRTAALLAAAELDGDVYLVPALPWRIPGALREIARRLGVPTPVELSTDTLVAIAQGAMLGKRGTIILDGRVHALAPMIDAITPPDGWRTILLAPGDQDDAAVIGARLDLPPPDPRDPRPLAPDLAAVLAAAAYFDPYEGAPRPLLAEVAGLEHAPAEAAIDRLIAAGRLRPARDRRRVLPTLDDHQHRPDPGDPTTRAFAERYVALFAAWCARAGGDARHLLADDRSNLMTSLSIWQEVAPVGLVDGFAWALPMLLDDAGCVEAAKLVISAARFGGDDADRLATEATRRMGWDFPGKS